MYTMALTNRPRSLSVLVLIISSLCHRACANRTLASDCGMQHFHTMMTVCLIFSVLLFSLLFGFANDTRTRSWTNLILNGFLKAIMALLLVSLLNYATEGADEHVDGMVKFAAIYLLLIGFFRLLAWYPRYLHSLSPIANHVASLAAIHVASEKLEIIRNDFQTEDHSTNFLTMWLCIVVVIMFFAYLGKAAQIVGHMLLPGHASPWSALTRRERRRSQARKLTAAIKQPVTVRDNQAHADWLVACDELCSDALAACLGCIVPAVVFYQVGVMFFNKGQEKTCKHAFDHGCNAKLSDDFHDFVFWVLWVASMWLISWSCSKGEGPAAPHAAQAQLALQATPSSPATPGSPAVQRRPSGRADSPPPPGRAAARPAAPSHSHEVNGEHGGAHHGVWHHVHEVLQLTSSFSASWGLLFASKYVCYVVWSEKTSIFQCLNQKDFEFPAALLLALSCSLFVLFLVWIFTVWSLFGPFEKVNKEIREYVSDSLCLFAALAWDQAFDEALEEAEEDADLLPYPKATTAIISAVVMCVYVCYMQPVLVGDQHEKED